MSDENFDQFVKHLNSYKSRRKKLSKDQIKEIATKVEREAQRHRALQETYCNRTLSAFERKQEERIETDITNLLKEVNEKIRVIFEGDPRGYTVKIFFPPRKDKYGQTYIPSNTWGGQQSGFGIGSSPDP